MPEQGPGASPASPLPVPAPPDRRESQAYLAVLCLFAFSFMLFQIALLRELRFQLTTLFTLTPFLFSTVVVCIALGSLIAGRIRERSGQVLRWSILLLPVLVPLLFASTIVISQSLLDAGSSRFNYGATKDPTGGDSYLHSTFIAFVAVAAGGYGLLFVLQGLIFSIYFREGRERGLLSGLYGADMIASGIGALVGGSLNFVLTPVQTVLVATATFLVTLWISFRPLQIKAVLVACASLLTIGIMAGEFSHGILSRLENPHWLPGMKFTVWSRYRRIDVAEPPGHLLVFTDGMPFHIYNRKDRSYAQDPRKLPVELIRRSEVPVRDVLIIGGGTGADVVVLRDLVRSPLNITAVELDPGFIQTARNIPWLWQYYQTAEIFTQEGRYYLENTSKQFDLVIFAYVDPQSAISSIGLPDANFLYTDAGLRAAWSRVREGGYLLVQRVFLKAEEEHFIRRLCATFESAGIPPAHSRVHVATGVGAWGYYGRISTLQAIARKGGEPMVLEDKSFVPQPWDSKARPTTDLFPFSLGTGIWFDTLLSYVRRNVIPLVIGAAVLIAIGAAAGTSFSRFNFFILGFGSFLLESLVLFNSFLLIGDPNLSAALAVGLFLLWNGVGSLISSRLESRRWIYAAVPAIVLFYALTAPLLNVVTIASSPTVRSLLFALHLAPAGIVAGLMFPVALRKFPDKPVNMLFFMDVIGCALAPPVFWLAVSTTGLWLIIVGAALSYALVCGLLWRRA